LHHLTLPATESRGGCTAARRGILAVTPDRLDAFDRTILLRRFRDGVDGGVLRGLLRPGAPVTLDLSWLPEADLFSPWRIDAVSADGRKLLSASSRAKDSDDMQLVIRIVSEHFSESEALIGSHIPTGRGLALNLCASVLILELSIGRSGEIRTPDPLLPN
jgi:hypothetical protein